MTKTQFSQDVKTSDQSKANFQFGILWTVVFALLAGWQFTKTHELNLWLVFGSLATIVTTFFARPILNPLRLHWIKLGQFLGLITTPIIMMVLYFFVLTPISLALKIFGVELLALAIDKDKKSYWQESEKIRDNYFNDQF